MNRLAALVLVLAAGVAAAEEPVSGVARARDGWTVAIGGVRVRFAGVLEPVALRQCGKVACDEAARVRLAALVDGHEITCSRERRLGHGIYRGVCAVKEVGDPALVLLREGLLRAAPDALPPYVAAQGAAEAAGLGQFAL